MACERSREHGIDEHQAAIHEGAARAHIRMRRHSTGDVWMDAKLLRAEELMAEARQCTARRPLLRDVRLPRRGVRVWVGAVLLAASERLLGPFGRLESGAPDSAGGAVADRSQGACPLCRRARPGLGGHPVAS